jgi:hypothetical protein
MKLSGIFQPFDMRWDEGSKASLQSRGDKELHKENLLKSSAINNLFYKLK